MRHRLDSCLIISLRKEFRDISEGHASVYQNMTTAFYFKVLAVEVNYLDLEVIF